MDNDVIDVNELTESTLKELRDFDENEAYFLLCEIFSNAQATKNYAQFQFDLNEWKRRYPVHLFSENYKSKIKYMLSNEFLNTILDNFIAFDELSKKDSSKGLERLRKVLDSAEKHKDEKRLNKDLESLYSEFPLSYLKEKYPHIVPQLVNKSNISRILEKFDSSDAFKQLEDIVSKPETFDNADMFKEAVEEWQKLYPIDEFSVDYKNQVEKLLSENLDEKRLEEIFPLDLSSGIVIPIEFQESLENTDILTKNALYDLFKIVDKNKRDVDGLFSWTCEYGKYINGFDNTSKNIVIENFMLGFANELPPLDSDFKIPKMDNELSFSDFENIDNIKKETIIQFLGILCKGSELTSEDKYKLGVVKYNSDEADIIKKAKIGQKLDVFMDIVPDENMLTISDNLYFDNVSDEEINLSSPSDSDLSLTDTNEDNSFKASLVVEGIEMQKVESSSNGSDSSTSGGGGVSNSIGLEPASEIKITDGDLLDESDKEKEKLEISPVIIETIEQPKDLEISNTDNIEEPIKEVVVDVPPEASTEIVEDKLEEEIPQNIVENKSEEEKVIDTIEAKPEKEISQNVVENKTEEEISQNIVEDKIEEEISQNVVEDKPEKEKIKNVIEIEPEENLQKTQKEKTFLQRLFRNDDDEREL